MPEFDSTSSKWPFVESATSIVFFTPIQSAALYAGTIVLMYAKCLLSGAHATELECSIPEEIGSMTLWASPPSALISQISFLSWLNRKNAIFQPSGGGRAAAPSSAILSGVPPMIEIDHKFAGLLATSAHENKR